MKGLSAGRLLRGIVLLAAVCAVNACRYDEPVTPEDLSTAPDRGTIPNASLMMVVDACESPATVIPISGASRYDPQEPVGDNAKLDATNAQFLLSQSVNQPVRYGGGTGICWSGGEVLGQFAPSYPWGDPYTHSKYGMLPGHTLEGGDNMIVENVLVFDYGDGISFDDPDPPAPPGTIDNWTIRTVHIKYSRDDCVQNDNYFNGTIESSFLDGCYTTVSSRGGTSAVGPDNVMTISHSLLRLQSMDVVYSETGQDDSKPGPGHRAFWKWELTYGPRLRLINNVFRADGPREGAGGSTNQDYMAPPPGKLIEAECSGNVIAWFGTETWEAANPTEQNPEVQYGSACFKIVTGSEAQEAWDSAVAVWQAKWDAAHPAPGLTDLAPPIVSMFPAPQYWPATTLTGPVTLVATAVDDRAVTSVHFKLTATGGTVYNIGAGVTVGSGDPTSLNGYAGPTKYRLVSWNSALVPNGTYTLTAVAEDAAGHVTESDGVPVEVSNAPNMPPVARYTMTVLGSALCDDAPGCFRYRFDGSSSYDPDGSIVSYAWYEGNVLVHTGPVFEGVYFRAYNTCNAGQENGYLVVTDNAGATSSACFSYTGNY